MYIGQIDCSITRLKEHQQHIHLEHPDKSAVVEHSINFRHHFQLHHTAILSVRCRYMDRIVKEVTEIEFHPESMKRGRSVHTALTRAQMMPSLGTRQPPP
jgi:hypothetical protein